ncbi:hypothetical protein [Sporosarcina sp. FA9]|uniref:hypothetical protein n=1 Tax=Sporosarcina sp. FA9 TaxID=3413030 RepID=UPI003F65B938
MTNKFSLTEESQNEILGNYASFLNDLQAEVNNFTDQLNEICEKTKFRPLVQLTIQAVNFYNDDLPKIVNEAFDEWSTSKGSLVGFIRQLDEEDEAATETARRLQGELKAQIEDMFAIKKSVYSGATDEPEISEDDYEVLQEIVRLSIGVLEDIKTTFMTKIEDEAEGNKVFLTIKPVVSSTAISAITAFSNYVDIVGEKRELFVEKIGQNTDSVNTVVEELKTQVERSAEDVFSELSNDML